MIKLFRLKLKSFSWLLFSSLIIFIIMLTFIYFSPVDINVSLIIVQLMFFFLSTIWGVQLFFELFGSGNFSYMWSFYQKNMGKIIFTFLIFFTIPITIIVFTTTLNYDSVQFLPVVTMLFSQCLLGVIASLILFSLFEDISIPISLMFLYVSVELATFGTSKYFYHVSLLNAQSSYNFDNTISLTILNIILGLVGYKILKLLIT